jgi:outer membrane protein OmpA-like peptidoglycan-associated protein
MSMRKLLACGIAAITLSPLATAVAYAAERCEVGQGCDLQGARGAMEDESLLQRRPFTPGGLPALPHNAERELPREKLILWQREGALGEREHLLDVGEETVESVVLRDGLPVVRFASGRSAVPQTDSDVLDTLMKRLTGKRNLRMRLVGHTDPEHLSVRTQAIYQDNQGLGLQRAKEVGAIFIERLNLRPEQLQFDSRGQSEPLVRGDSPQAWATNRRVEVEIWYDESIVSTPAKPLECAPGSVDAGNVAPFRLSIDGQPQGEQAAGSANSQRCVDVALARDLLQVRYDNLSAKPRLNLASDARVARIGQPLRFAAYSNYQHWIERGEVRILGKKRLFGEPELLASIELDPLLQGEWTPSADLPEQVYYQLRVYDAEGRFDETSVQSISVARGDREAEEHADSVANLLAGYDGNRLARHTIPVAGGTVTVNGKQVKDEQTVFVLGRPVPVDRNGSFASTQIIPRGLHTVEVAVLDDEGKGRIYRRDLRLPTQDWFTVAIADFTFGQQNTSGPAQLVTGEDRYYDDKRYLDGRLAFYSKGVINDRYTVTASVDTGQEAADSLFSNFNDKDPREFLRRMDTENDKGWTTFGDDSTLVEDAPTRGKFYARVEDEKSHAMWGNFRQQTRDTELAQIDRSLYGAQARWRSDGFTSFGERRLQIEGFAAEPGTASAREDFRGTGGSLYYLRHQDITTGSERVRIEVRDKDSGLVLQSQDLVAGIDYEVNAMQGRVILSQPLSGNADGSGLIRSGGSLSGHPAYLVVGYEYSPGLDRLDDLAYGGRAAWWVDDKVRVGVTGSQQEQTGREDQTLGGADLLLRHSEGTWLKLETAQSRGDSLDQRFSYDGGFGFGDQNAGSDSRARANRIETAFDLRDVLSDAEGHGTFYYEKRDAGFAAPGRLTDQATEQVGGSYTTALSEKTELTVKGDQTDEDGGRSRRALEGTIAYDLSKAWRLSLGLRNDRQTTGSAYRNLYTGTYAGYDNGNYDEGERNDAIVQALYHEAEDWSVYGFGQATLSRDGSREENNRLGVGGDYRLSERTSLNGELSGGSLGLGAKAGVNHDASERTNLYLNYQLDNDRGDDGFASRSGLYGSGRTGQVVTGARSRWTDSVSVYTEQRMQHGDQAGMIQGYGLDFAPDERWSYGLTSEFGTFNRESDYEIKRRAYGAKVGYSNGDLRYASRLEYRNDQSDVQELSVWLMRNNLSYQVNPDWRFLGRLDFSVGDSDRGDYFDGDFIEASLGYAYRPVLNDRLNLLAKYTYLADLPPPDQVSTATGTSVDYAQRSHVFAIDGIYDLSERWSVGGKYAYRLSELRMSRDTSADWFGSRGQLLAVRVDWHVVKKWDLMAEVRRREESQARDSKNGALVGVYRHFGNNFKMGVGYNFSDFSDDLTDLSYRSQGWFLNAVGKY